MTEQITLWCIVKGKPVPFKVTVPCTNDISDLKKLIHTEAIGQNQLPLATDLVLWKVRHP